METIAARLDACQDKILELYEKDSEDLKDQIEHWKLMRLESVLLYKAREMGLTMVGHQVVPTLLVSKAKAHKAIGLQLALETLQQSEYNTEPWTLQDTSMERWEAPPKGCLKKGGKQIEVHFDGDAKNCMPYVMWSYIYVYTENIWTKVPSGVDARGLYYDQEGARVYYADFANDANMYGTNEQWEVHVGSHVIFSPASVSSTKEISVAGPVATPTANAGRSHTTHSSVGPQEGATTDAPPPRKRPKHRELCQQPHSTTAPLSLDSGNNKLFAASDHHNKGRNPSCGATAPIVHLKGEPNTLKCFRNRLRKYRGLYEHASSTWHWASQQPRNSKSGIVTVTYTSEEQRAQFLLQVQIPPSITASQGVMSL
ncbi:E2 [Macaca mulatta papillomavirus 2]|uniref:Regulatory protein E2 n=1 Tax=Macaca mulatta papillomavirus 2 TaxID=2294150 RepID=A0A385AGX3_9PAPI|nr:E2 [Macaca mulatta papillomavirus 2]AXN57283.1 E2 [Macaca mulatta papillomavirus 2]